MFISVAQTFLKTGCRIHHGAGEGCMPTVQLQLTTKALGLAACLSYQGDKSPSAPPSAAWILPVTATQSQFPSILAEKVTLPSATSSACLWRWHPGVGVPFPRTVLWPQEDRQLAGRTACICPAGLQVRSQLVTVVGWAMPLEIPTESNR